MKEVTKEFADLLEMLSTVSLVHQATPASKETKVVTAFQELPVCQDSTARKVTLESALLVAQVLKVTEETADWTESMAHPDSEVRLANVDIPDSRVTMVFSVHLVYPVLRLVGWV